MPSPYPALDDFVLSDRQRVGGNPGVLAGWHLYISSQSSIPGVYPDNFKLKYTVMKNKWCANIGRHHKSNGIFIVADLTCGFLYQSCYDPVGLIYNIIRFDYLIFPLTCDRNVVDTVLLPFVYQTMLFHLSRKLKTFASLLQ